ncbi:MAG: 23S rRNA (pseudouridine(1915)-N(3))-methyltransferase RlmH [Deltaproteobacteria bacterium]
MIVAVGRAKEPAFRALLDDYYARIRRYATLDEVEIREEREDKVEQAIARAMTSAGTRAELVALDVKGKAFTSEAFAQKLGRGLDGGAVPVFAIGAAEGLPLSVRARAAWALSLGTMTLPHRLARVVLSEQVYRAFTILRGEPYAREG